MRLGYNQLNAIVKQLSDRESARAERLRRKQIPPANVRVKARFLFVKTEAMSSEELKILTGDIRKPSLADLIARFWKRPKINELNWRDIEAKVITEATKHKNFASLVKHYKL